MNDFPAFMKHPANRIASASQETPRVWKDTFSTARTEVRWRSGQVGPQEEQRVWQRRFYDFNVWGERKRVEKLRSMHRNPVKRGLVLEPEQWEWSSYRSYGFGEEGMVKINQWPKAVMKIRSIA